MDILKSPADRDVNDATPTLTILNLSNDLPTLVESSKKQISCKFVVIANAHRQWLLFGTVAEYPYHANLVERFCTTNQLAHNWRPARDMVDIADANYRIRGGGFVEIDPQSKLARFSGSSKAYGSIPATSLRQLLKNQSVLPGFKARLS